MKIRLGTFLRWFRKRRVLLRENRELREITMAQRLTLLSNQREITMLQAAIDRLQIALHVCRRFMEMEQKEKEGK